LLREFSEGVIRMLKRSIGVLGALAVGLIFAGSAAGQTSWPADASSSAPSDATQVDVQNKDIYCPTALEPILPGDYYGCEARAALGHDNHKKMVDMLEESAYWANKDAQYVLGLTYFNGDMDDVPQNRPLGLAWLALAAERKKPQYQLAYAEARSKATPEEIRQAVVLWRQMRTKYGDSVAAPRAIRRFNHAIEPIDESAKDGGIVYIHGFSPYSQSAFAVANKLHEEASNDFEDIHGQVVVGKPEWLQAPPVTTNGSQASGSSQSQ
jgi:TPR repeat protein